MSLLPSIGVIISILLIIYLAVKGYSIVFIGPLCAIVAMLFNDMNIFEYLITADKSYFKGLANFVVSFSAMFMLGSILAKYMEESGAAKSIAASVLKVTGKDKPYSVLLAIFLISTILSYGGISIFVIMFAVLPMARPIFKEMNLSWSLVAIPLFLGAATFTMTMMPGTPTIQNVVPTTFLGTTVTAAPLLGILGSAAAIAFGLLFMKYELKLATKNGEKYTDTQKISEDEVLAAEAPEVKMPNIFISLLPSILLVSILIGGSAMKIPNIILIGLLVSNVVSAILFNGYIKSHKTILNSGAEGAVMPIFFTAAAVGFGIVITAAPGFQTIFEKILNMQTNPLVGLSIATSVITVITGSSSATLGIVMGTFAEQYLNMGIQPEVLHRVSAIASSALTPTPHSGVMLAFFAMAGLSHKNAYKRFAITIAGANTLATIVVVIAAMLLY
ncbi:GntP family permease [Acidaminobacter sp.]|uniref:GntP family permease n=1 Tax=Acidaminobacter sp. TaxID=1872102 RepID=UPI00256A8A52|nr:Na+/H+ antiporter NhaC family protein [Acidaminobacter sp.]MDK9711142.1 SLC13 family permease [Acidaminobacter sp.]